jgi:hypothetical protein
MIEINQPVNIVSFITSTLVGSERGEIVILGKDKSVTMVVTKTLATSAYTDLNTLNAINEEDPVDDQGAQKTADPSTRFTASYIGFDNSNDMYNTVMVVKKGTQDFLKVNLRSMIREDMLNALDKIQNI